MLGDQYRTRVLGINLSDDVYSFLEAEGMDVYHGDYGPIIDARGKFDGYYKLPVADKINIPKNLQEYDVIIEDMHHEFAIEYSQDDNKINPILSNDNNNELRCYCIHYPQTEYNPIPLGCYRIHEALSYKKSPIIKIAFQEMLHSANYTGITSGRDVKDLPSHTNYDYLSGLCSKSIGGDKVKMTDNMLSHILFEDLGDISYYQTFRVPITTDYKPLNGFTPILTNEQGDIISYMLIANNNITIILPQIKDKLKLLKRLFYDYLYKFESQFFPMQTANSWLSNPEYELPEVIRLEQDKKEIRDKADEDIKEKDAEIKACHDKLAFLYGMLTDTGDDLVDDVIAYLKWLDFENVNRADDDVEEGGLLQEDIQVRINGHNLLIIEVKGIHGTSTDNECAQIGKNILRRMREHIYNNVYGLYIVNNEMGKEPLKRTLPPFNDTQIKDAENSTRGLAYTNQLFNLYFEIESGVITKDEARQSLLDFGLVNFRKKFNSLGKPYKYYQDNTVICLDLHDTEIKIGDSLYFEDSRKRLLQCHVVSIQQGKKPLESVTNGETGFGLDIAVLKGVDILTKS